jgi:hypothetical protein
MLQGAVTAVGVGSLLSQLGGDQTALCGSLEQGDVAHIVEQCRIPGTVSQDQKLNRKFNVN